MYLNHPKNHPHLHCPQKSCLPQNQSLVPKRLETAGLDHSYPPFTEQESWRI